MAASFYFCRVESVFDESDGLRIKVRIPTIDPNERADPYLERVPYAFPLLPKHLHVNPRVGEMVLVFLQNPSAPKGGRFSSDRLSPSNICSIMTHSTTRHKY